MIRALFSRCRNSIKSCERNGSNIPIILVQELESRGRAGDIIEVKRGYARNLLIPRKIALYATRENKLKYAKPELKEKEEQQEKVHEFVAGEVIPIERAANTRGQLYDPIVVHDINDHLRMTLGKIPKSVFIPTPIKKIGRHNVFLNDTVEIFVDIAPSTIVA